MSLESFPRYPLMFGPSPIHRLDRLSEYLEGATVWAKRDDVNSPLAFGGNKIRKLEYLVADALASGCDTLVSIGGVQSNHTRQVAAAAAKTGMKCVLIQESWVDWPDVTYDRVGNILLSRLMGADVRLVRAGFGIGFKESWEKAILEIEDRGGKPYAIPAGASDHPLGGLGFAGWAEGGRAPRGRTRRRLRLRLRLLGDRRYPGRHGRRLRARRRRRARSSASTPRPNPSRPGSRSRASRARPRNSSASNERSPTRRSSSTTDSTPAPTASPISARSRPCDSGPRSRR